MARSDQPETRTGPLAGVRILDFSRVLAGPYCSALLADLGADVLKVEAPQGDDYRHIGPFYKDGSSVLFEAVNRNKRGIVLDLSSPEGRAVAQRLARGADIVVENFRPGVADRLGIGWAELSGSNPRLIYASISGFGQRGPEAARPAYDIVLQAMSGIMASTGEADGPPTLIGEPIADVASGLFGAWAILAALYERERTGSGRRIDLAMFDAMIALQPLGVARTLATGTPPQRVGNRNALSAPFGAFAARDGQFVLAVLNPKLFAVLADLIARPDIVADPRFISDSNRLQNEPELRAIIESWSSQRTASQAVAALVAAGIPAAEVSDMGGALEQAERSASTVVQEVSHPALGTIKVPDQPARFDGLARGAARAAPRLGEHAAMWLDEAKER
jgi:CoA:oxalate CoA-transferase